MAPQSQSGQPEQFPVDDRPVYDAYVASRQSAALAVGVRVGLFEHLAQAPANLQALSQQFSFSLRGTRSLLTALRAMRLVDEQDGVYSLTDVASRYLVRGRSGWLSCSTLVCCPPCTNA